MEFILIFFEEILSAVLKINNRLIKNFILISLLLIMSVFVFFMLYILIGAIFSTVSWIIKIILFAIFIPCMYVIYIIILNGYSEWKN